MPVPTHRAALLAALLLSGCASYRPAPLPEAPLFPAGIPVPAQLAAGTHPFDATDGLDITEAATLAAVNNPDLRSARAAARVTAAQSFAAGLLPDPQVNLSRDFPTGAAAAGASSAFVFGLGYALNALVTHAATAEAGRQDVRQSQQALLWQEWQVIAQARLLFVRLQGAARRRELLLQTRAVLADRYDRTHRALDQGLLTLDAVTPFLTALQDVDRQLHDLDRQAGTARLDFNTLLGLAPRTTVPLQGAPSAEPIDAAAVRAHMPALINRRPDIQALRAGYAAQDARLRVALLNQFPAMTLGVQRSRDNSNAYTRGFALSLGLPLLNGNRGELRLQDATRDKLRTDYQQRLNAGSFDLERILAEQRTSLQQLADTDTALAALRSARDRMRAAYAARNIDALTLSTLESAMLAKEGEHADAEQALQEQRIGLLALTGMPESSFAALPTTPAAPTP